MSLTVKEEKREFKPDPEGLYEAKCISVIDMGEQLTEYKNVQKYKPLIMLEFEIPEIVIEYEKDGVKKQFNKVIRKKYTANLGEKSNLRKDLNSWRGKALTEEELQKLITSLHNECSQYAERLESYEDVYASQYLAQAQQQRQQAQNKLHRVMISETYNEVA